ncbi:MAG: Coq4 family protein [Saprospiraceae bacterium]
MKTTLTFREKLLINLVEWTKPWYGQFFQKSKTPWKIGLEKLKTFPPKTLGGDLAHFLENEGLSLMPKFESHDVYHVLLKYKTTVVDEARMQFFLMGNRKYSLYIIGTNLIALIFYPEQIRSFIKEFQKGRKAISIAKWNFEFLLNEPTRSLRKMIFRRPNQNMPLTF